MGAFSVGFYSETSYLYFLKYITFFFSSSFFLFFWTQVNKFINLLRRTKLDITFFKGGLADSSLQEKKHPTASKI
jgi:hypothetical protein